MIKNNFQSLLQRYFLNYMISQKRVSYCTILNYRDTFRMLFKFFKDELKINSSKLTMNLMCRDNILNFMKYLEKVRKNKSRTINNRLAAIKSFMQYVSYEYPEYAQLSYKINIIPFRKIIKNEVNYLTKEEIESLLNACDNSSTIGSASYLIILLLYNTGVRVSEMISLKKDNVFFSNHNHCYIKVMGKGRKERTIPLWNNTSKYLIKYIEDNKIQIKEYLFSGRNIVHLTRSGVRHRIDCVVKLAEKKCASLKNKKITPHVFRHSTAMSLLQAGVDISTIAILLGHESVETTHKYMIADLKIKEVALSKIQNPNTKDKNTKYHPANDILKFLNEL
jgi:site-specific recombinase XerD